MRSRRDQVQAHAYVVGRLTSALVHGEPDSPESPLRRTGLGSFGGLLLGTLMVAAFLVWGLISAGSKTAAMTAGELIMAKETGARYIYAGHELRPVLNWSSALLLTGGNAAMTVVPAASLTGIPQGQPVGIVGAPDTMPAAGAANQGAWLVCALSAGHPQVSLTIGTSTPVRQPPPNGALLVRAQGTEYLVWRGQRLKLDASWIAGALGLGRAPVTDVSPAWLNAVPAGPDLRPIDVAWRGGPGPVIGTVRTTVGQVLVTSNVGSQSEFYLVEAGALVPITAAQAAIVLGDPSSAAAGQGATGAPVPVSPAAMVHAPIVHQSLADTAGAPSAPPPDDSATPGVPCMRYTRRRGLADVRLRGTATGNAARAEFSWRDRQPADRQPDQRGSRRRRTRPAAGRARRRRRHPVPGDGRRSQVRGAIGQRRFGPRLPGGPRRPGARVAARPAADRPRPRPGPDEEVSGYRMS